MTKVVVLGWGSLLWDTKVPKGKRFEEFFNEDWNRDGPEIPLESSRISGRDRDGNFTKARKGALTLVVHSKGRPCQVAWRGYKKEIDADAAIEALRVREGTNSCQIGRYFKKDGEPVFKDRASFDAIVAWANARKDVSTVIWTDLYSNFEKITKKPFTIDAAVEHLKILLGKEGETKAAEYIGNAPDFVKTDLRDHLEKLPCSKKLLKGYSPWTYSNPKK
jgi:hypothetical protein